MSKYHNKYNHDDVHMRSVIVGMVNLLNQKVHFQNVYSETESEDVFVPFYFNNGAGDERFMQDYFLQWSDCVTPKMVDGNVDPVPRGIVTLGSSSINTNMLTNRFVRGTYVKEVRGELLSYSAYLNSIPLTVSFDMEILVASYLDALKVQQSLLETFYKTQVFSVNFRGFRIPCQAGFSEEYSLEKTFEFTYQDENKVMVKFSVEVETYYPVIDKTTERFNGNRMLYGSPNMSESFTETYQTPRITFEAPLDNERYFSSGVMPIQWTTTGPVLRVNLLYRHRGGGTWKYLARNIPNSGSYMWKVPFFDGGGLEIAKDPIKASVISNSGYGAEIRAVTDSLGQIERFIIFDNGVGYSNVDLIYVEDAVFPPLNRHICAAIVAESKVQGGTLPAYTSEPNGFQPLPQSIVSQLEIKVEDANDPEVYKIMPSKASVEFSAGLTNGSAIITIVSGGSGLDVGMFVEGQGIQPDTVISSFGPGINDLTLSKVVTQTLTSTILATSGTDGYVEVI